MPPQPEEFAKLDPRVRFFARGRRWRAGEVADLTSVFKHKTCKIDSSKKIYEFLGGPHFFFRKSKTRGDVALGA